MAKSPVRDEALEALDFIINILKEHEKALDELTQRLEACLGGAPQEKHSSLRSSVGERLKNWR